MTRTTRGLLALTLLIAAGCSDKPTQSVAETTTATPTTTANPTPEPAQTKPAQTKPPRRSCPNLGEGGFGVVRIYVRGVDCDAATRVMTASRGRDSWTANGLRCRKTAEYRQPGYQDAGHEDYRCTGSGGRSITYRATFY